MADRNDTTSKACNRCGVVKPLTAFGFRTKTQGFRPTCKSCVTVRRRELRSLPPRGKRADYSCPPIGKMVGRYIEVVGLGVPRDGRVRWIVKCHGCGRLIDRSANFLATGSQHSCGCKTAEMRSERKTTHGATRGKAHGEKVAPEYLVWLGMRRRCSDEKDKRYMDYGGRGIVVCDEWRDDFAAFIAHVGPRPSPKHSIDRIDNDRGYEPGNVRWATAREQRANQRRVKLIEFAGESKPLKWWAQQYGINHNVLRCRVDKGWDFGRALTTPADTPKTRIRSKNGTFKPSI